MSLKVFLKSKTFLVQILLLIAVFAILAYLSMMMLKVYTHHGKTKVIPDFVGLSESDAATVVKKNRLRYEIFDSLFVPEAIPESVVSQYPPAGYRVKQGRTIFLTLAAVSPEKVKLPFVVDVSLREAQSRLENAGLSLGKVEYRPSEFINLVLDKSLNGLPLTNETLLVKGTAIDLIVGKGLSNEVTEIPDLSGHNLADAKKALYNVGLNIGALIYDNSLLTNEDTLFARVWKQNPAFTVGNYLELGTSVDIWLTVDQEKLFVSEDADTIINYETEF